MGTDVTEVMETLPCPRDIKVHCLMCTKLIKLLDRILKVFPEIEASRPRCSSGIQTLCLLNGGIDKAKSLLWYCSESSKLYLAITADAILSRCNKSCKLLEQSLIQIQSNVPVMLAAEISLIIHDLRGASFSLDSAEKEAGKLLRAFIQQYASSGNSVDISAVETIRFATLRLRITSQKDVLIEKRSIKKLIDKVGDTDPAKKQILWFFMDLLKKYGKFIVGQQTENDYLQHKESLSFPSSYDESVQAESHAEHGPEATNGVLCGGIPLEEFKCPISLRLMYDPVVIASGQTFERMWIQKWFDEGHDTCPKTKKKLVHLSLTPNVSLKDLISKWCAENGVTIPDPCVQSAACRSLETSSTSIDSLSSMIDLHLPVDFSNVSLGSLDSNNSDSLRVKITDGSNSVPMHTNNESQKFQYCANTHEKKPSLNKLDKLPWESQCEMVKDVKSHLDLNNQTCHLLSYENFIEPLIRFLKSAQYLHDVKAQRSGTQLLLAFLRICGSVPNLHEEAYSLLASFIDSEVTEEALAIIELLSCHRCCGPKIVASGAPYSILKILETQSRKFVEPAIIILYNLSSSSDISSVIVPSEIIPKLVPFFEDVDFARYCISILKNLCDDEGCRVSVAETNGCIASIAKLLESDSHEVQEHAVTVLLSLCSQRVQYCWLVMEEGVIPSLISISINGNDKGKAIAMELLRVLKDIDYSGAQESSGSDFDLSRDSSNHSKEKKSSSKASGFFGVRSRSIFSKPSSLATRKKK
ncbi:U-box domain-containing protein [Actinidia chinensis var. chinensis]|uniref:RING-type E3 ubiquitin transferase n=1 Tax=Actinidia chinensis var. chinensis TaxID=1590841 RepID=A0A2R6RLC5_ACTCC|nr:U-box domain-containing protein [Actinidia chinensis var. chinensis]